jgi:myo-inositol-1(or 4)-monophosphatase
MTASRSDIEVALSAASAGSRVVRAAYGSELVRHTKRGHDFTTDADLDAERAILEVIAEARPEDVRIGEETGTTGGSSSRRWLVDPLCGTLNFAAQTPLVAVNVALVDVSCVAAVCADPIAGEFFWSEGQHSYRRCDGDDTPLSPSGNSRMVDVNCDGPTNQPFVGPQLITDPTFRAAFAPRVMSTTLAVAWVAAGRRAAYLSDGWFTENVHFTAGIEVCRSAGCVISDLAGNPLNTGRGLIVAADPETHARLVDIVRPHLRDVLASSAVPTNDDEVMNPPRAANPPATTPQRD